MFAQTGQPKDDLLEKSTTAKQSLINPATNKPHSECYQNTCYYGGAICSQVKCILQQMFCIACCIPSLLLACICVCKHAEKGSYKQFEEASNAACWLCPK